MHLVFHIVRASVDETDVDAETEANVDQEDDTNADENNVTAEAEEAQDNGVDGEDNGIDGQANGVDSEANETDGEAAEVNGVASEFDGNDEHGENAVDEPEAAENTTDSADADENDTNVGHDTNDVKAKIETSENGGWWDDDENSDPSNGDASQTAGSEHVEHTSDVHAEVPSYRPPQRKCRSDDVVRCENHPEVEICGAQQCDGQPDCPDGSDELASVCNPDEDGPKGGYDFIICVARMSGLEWWWARAFVGGMWY